VADPDVDDLERRMKGAVEVLRHEFAGLRTGRASVNLLEPIVVSAYGAEMPLNQVATIGVPEPRLLSVQVWDRGQVQAVEKAIQSSGLGLNPIIEGQTLRIPIPELNEERRAELARVAAKYAEQAKVSVRNVRRAGMDQLKKMEKSSELSKDDSRVWSDEIQKMTDDTIKVMIGMYEAKEKEILQV
jgi:ribosome recycling factor